MTGIFIFKRRSALNTAQDIKKQGASRTHGKGVYTITSVNIQSVAGVKNSLGSCQ